MTATTDSDPVLESLLDELRAVLVALNEQHQPVNPATPRRVAESTLRVEALRAQIAARRRELRGA